MEAPNLLYLGKVTSMSDTGIAMLYWHSPYTIDKIRERCHLSTASAKLIAERAGPSRVDGFACENCGDEIRFHNRTHANIFVKRFVVGDQSWAAQGRSVLCVECEKRVDGMMAQYKAKVQGLRAQPYADYLKTDHWQKTRQKALLRAGYKCQVCSAVSELHVHHRTYLRRGEERASDVIVLCAECHGIFHANGKLAENGRAA
jgi:5-methylcytosine-specific restriction endonuclease McrA